MGRLGAIKSKLCTGVSESAHRESVWGTVDYRERHEHTALDFKGGQDIEKADAVILSPKPGDQSSVHEWAWPALAAAARQQGSRKVILICYVTI